MSHDITSHYSKMNSLEIHSQAKLCLILFRTAQQQLAHMNEHNWYLFSCKALINFILPDQAETTRGRRRYLYQYIVEIKRDKNNSKKYTHLSTTQQKHDMKNGHTYNFFSSKDLIDSVSTRLSSNNARKKKTILLICRRDYGI